MGLVAPSTAEGAPLHATEVVSKEVFDALRKLSGEINDLSNNLFNARISNEEGSASGSLFLKHAAILNNCYLK